MLLHQHELDQKTHPTIFAAGVFLAGVVGALAGGWLSEGILRSTGNVALARISVIVLGFLGAFVMHVAGDVPTDLVTKAISLSAACFCAD
ncbi:hypothetical protein DPM13_12750 [Paracoccus mutanolyticus]|uniref:Uncharacterized protein n=1 Tax=Paracoccus mutanolyticus TaxID=1499308 RepID=A0ABN5MCV3_9RHOB|nr:hypothetical protein [Paracoccus mutanolyticus]AWX93653.1 hypothetical protein DPM13_12750 [Paracoccus mutanolyticus]